MADTRKLNPVQKAVVGVQFLFVAFGATVLVPLLVGMDPSVALFTAGIGTLIFHLVTKGKVPIFLGSSFAFIAPIALAFAKDGISGYATGIIGVGIVYILFALLIKIFGKDWIDKLLPPVVIGPMIMIIGLSLAPSAIGQIGLNSGSLEWKSLVVALVTFLVTAITAVGAKGFFKIIPFLTGIISGIVSGTGMGGGTILILILSVFMGIDQHVAQATNLIFFVPTSITAIVTTMKEKLIDWKIGIPVAISGIIGAIFGAKISVNMN